MAIDPGKRLGPYEIHSAIGAGAMGDALPVEIDRMVGLGR
jgi:hypothetical protein